MLWNSLKALTRAEKLSEQVDDPEPRWPAVVTVLALGGLYTALPDELTLRPRLLLPSIVLVLLIPSIIAHHTGRQRLNIVLGFAVEGILTLGLAISVALLIATLPAHRTAPQMLLQSAALLWITNILVFALWYWRLDAGGPHQRDRRAKHSEGSFLFPQTTMNEESLKQAGQENWSPQFIDYLFLAFNTSTAFSPTDVPVLTKWAKILMMLQSLLSLLIIALLAARAVNIL
ncbi:MAG TPA: hypothetical protein VHV54_13755 [Candidatus Binatia bacterium]|nr:hypothetical protein [Candidatus Binatia bacterium]